MHLERFAAPTPTRAGEHTRARHGISLDPVIEAVIYLPSVALRITCRYIASTSIQHPFARGKGMCCLSIHRINIHSLDDAGQR